ncbi:MAG: UDP-3-O-acyl-N-acetylglucosamine deacetylase [Syntrophorhabdaceae bacterium]|nr:UDP-3-O-acyl-N-acetylglucosamine deacetylase [Syntrophorhabdaceae bacterium]
MKKILIIDDEKAILDSLSPLLEDEGFIVFKATDGPLGLDIYKKEEPDIVLLDIWMPGLDGLQVLKEIKKLNKGGMVIVISGHGTISTAVEAVKMGAFDFVEKPLSIDKILEVIKRGTSEERPLHSKTEEIRIGPLKGLDVYKQKTIGKSIVAYGLGLHTGVKTGMILLPMPENTGIVFEHIPDGERIPAYVDYVFSVGYASLVKGKNCMVRTVEHLMATLHMYGITNILVKVSEEVPIFDGSAREICRKIEEAGIIEQDAGIEPIVIGETVELQGIPEGKSIKIEPSKHLEIDYVLEGPKPIGFQEFHFVCEKEGFIKEIAPARTYGFLKDFERLEKMGLGTGGRVSNLIILNEEGVINTELRFENEFVRHKVLDLIGDLYLLNRPIIGKITARQTGHIENIALAKELKNRFVDPGKGIG